MKTKYVIALIIFYIVGSIVCILDPLDERYTIGTPWEREIMYGKEFK